MNSENSRNFAKYRKQLELLLTNVDESAKRVVSRMADAGMKETIRNTPVGDYSRTVFFYTQWGEQVSFTLRNKPIGGTLKKAWRKTAVRKAGISWVSGYENGTEYALYVNNGHRTVNKFGETTGFVKGVRMLEQGINCAGRHADAIFQQEVARVKAKTGF